MDDSLFWPAVDRVKRVIYESDDIKFLLVLRVFLMIARVRRDSITTIVNNYTNVKANNDKMQKNILNKDIILTDKDISRIINELVKKDLIFDPVEYHHYEYWIKHISSPMYVEPSERHEGISDDLVHICDRKIDELIISIPADDYVPIIESGRNDGGRLSIEICSKNKNIINLKLFDRSSPSDMVILRLAISKDDHTSDAQKFEIYQRCNVVMESGFSYLNLDAFGDGKYRIITETVYDLPIICFSVFVFEIKNGKISSIEEKIDELNFDQHRTAYSDPKSYVVPQAI